MPIGRLISILLRIVVAITNPSVPFWIPLSTVMEIESLRFNLRRREVRNPSDMVPRLSSRVARPALFSASSMRS